jgi:competence protein ComEC
LLKKPGFATAISGTTLLKVPHHGRKEGRSPELFKHIHPMLCIISDKEIDDANENTAATTWYTARSRGCNVHLPDGTKSERKVLTTRCDKSVHVQANSAGRFWVFAGTQWKDSLA